MAEDIIYPIPANKMDVAEEFTRILDFYEKQALEAQADFNANMRRINVVCRDEVKKHWLDMASAAGVDAELSWGNAEYWLDRQYIKHGFAAIRFTPAAPNPFMTAMQDKNLPGEHNLAPNRNKMN